MRTLKFRVDGVPQPQGSMSGHVRDGHVVMHHKPELLNWRRVVNAVAAATARREGISLPLDGPLIVKYVFHRAKPKTVKAATPDTKPDLDKYVRAVNDALAPRKGQGVSVIAEDSRIVAINARKRWADGPPGVEVAITEEDT